MTDLGSVKTEFVLKTSAGTEVEIFDTAEAANTWNDLRAKKTEARGGVVPYVRLVKRTIIEEEVAA